VPQLLAGALDDVHEALGVPGTVGVGVGLDAVDGVGVLGEAAFEPADAILRFAFALLEFHVVEFELVVLAAEPFELLVGAAGAEEPGGLDRAGQRFEVGGHGLDERGGLGVAAAGHVDEGGEDAVVEVVGEFRGDLVGEAGLGGFGECGCR
jgi:hypothetical protein